MLFGVYVPTFGEYDVKTLAQLAREAEAADWDASSPGTPGLDAGPGREPRGHNGGSDRDRAPHRRVFRRVARYGP